MRDYENSMWGSLLIEELKTAPKLRTELQKLLSIPDHTDTTKYVTVSEAAMITGRTPQTIHNWCNAGRLEYTQFGKMLFIAESELTAKLKAGVIRASK